MFWRVAAAVCTAPCTMSVRLQLLVSSPAVSAVAAAAGTVFVFGSQSVVVAFVTVVAANSTFTCVSAFAAATIATSAIGTLIVSVRNVADAQHGCSRCSRFCSCRSCCLRLLLLLLLQLPPRRYCLRRRRPLSYLYRCFISNALASLVAVSTADVDASATAVAFATAPAVSPLLLPLPHLQPPLLVCFLSGFFKLLLVLLMSLLFLPLWSLLLPLVPLLSLSMSLMSMLPQ